MPAPSSPARSHDSRAPSKPAAKESSAQAKVFLEAVEAERVRAFLDTRPDLTREQRASVEGLPIERVRKIVNAILKCDSASDKPRTDPELLRVDRMMGVAPRKAGECELVGNTLYLGGAPGGVRASAEADDSEELKRKMGIAPRSSGQSEFVGSTLYLGGAPRSK